MQGLTKNDVVIPPKQFQYVSCKPKKRLRYKGKQIAIVNNKYKDWGVNCIVETANTNTFAIPVLNDSDVPLKLRANSPIVSLTPICNEEQLYPIDVDSVLDGDIKHCNAVKKRGPKPSFSRPLCPDDAGGSDEDIVRQCVEKYAKRLSRDRKEQLIQLILKYREAFSLRGELGRTTNFKYQLRFHPEAKFLH